MTNDLMKFRDNILEEIKDYEQKLENDKRNLSVKMSLIASNHILEKIEEFQNTLNR